MVEFRFQRIEVVRPRTGHAQGELSRRAANRSRRVRRGVRPAGSGARHTPPPDAPRASASGLSMSASSRLPHGRRSTSSIAGRHSNPVVGKGRTGHCRRRPIAPGHPVAPTGPRRGGGRWWLCRRRQREELAQAVIGCSPWRPAARFRRRSVRGDSSFVKELLFSRKSNLRYEADSTTGPDPFPGDEGATWARLNRGFQKAGEARTAGLLSASVWTVRTLTVSIEKSNSRRAVNSDSLRPAMRRIPSLPPRRPRRELIRASEPRRLAEAIRRFGGGLRFGK